MALPASATALRGLGCHNCRQWALRTFIASIGGKDTSSTVPQQRRTIAQSTWRSNSARERVQEHDHILNDINDIAPSRWTPANSSSLASYDGAEERAFAEVMDSDTGVDDGNAVRSFTTLDQRTSRRVENGTEIARDDVTEEQKEGSSIPWYLQQSQQPTEPPTFENPMAARQQIPDLPDHAPSILEPLLNNISIEQGMDDLNLLDLRTIDPPPALGSNLIMIVGTARSDKHLHVSADRLCRWIRTKYKDLTPYADGLLGRNELKLKLKRRAKRTRLINAVGASHTSAGSGSAEDSDMDVEEGIRTGWVCVNIGRVEGGELPEQKARREEREKGLVGFGEGESGCAIVVQLMTEEKREEVGLERLWGGILRASRKEAAAVAAEKEERDAGVLEQSLGSGEAVNDDGEQPRVVGIAA
ncbi:ATPase synthesis protein 25 mitochondrial [Recurvomyces mirabilis]|uniref:ATPase synthesis protein 25 n=1 Tax=Recurvomyces mirabilis TaxID=574656 RepID=A0AAE0WUM7_9PEZI|nr:ATPase synthesis protein 25 mitochondrial [Recurvomyces mirabilis]KAK5160693.1 ATPase synthesis protein 25 mitochondrial [Recurvomyces mirabilis]